MTTLQTAVNVVVGFAVVFGTPYGLRQFGSALAYIWGGFAFLSSVWAWFFMPELKVCLLELVQKRPTWIYILIIILCPGPKFGGD